jgi:hypothetical protein
MKNLKSKIMDPIIVVGYFACSLISRVSLKISNIAAEKSSTMLSKILTTNY